MSYRTQECNTYGPAHFSRRLRAKLSALNGLSVPHARRHKSAATLLMKAQARAERKKQAERKRRAVWPKGR